MSIRAAWRTLVRWAVILGLGGVAIAGAWLFRRAQEPAPVPDPVQREGVALAEASLRLVDASDFGRTERGSMLSATIRGLLEDDRVIFTSEISAQAKYVVPQLGQGVLYVRVFQLRPGEFRHQDTAGIAESLYHESVHVLREGSASVEEECDGFAAGVVAGAIARGEPVPETLLHDGIPLARFVLEAYTELSRDPEYRPIGRTLQWLEDAAQLSPR